MLSPLDYLAPGLKAWGPARRLSSLGARGALFASMHPRITAGALIAGGVLGTMGAAKLVGGISPWGTSRGAPSRALGGASIGAAAGLVGGALINKYVLGRIPMMGSIGLGKLGLYGAAAGALLGAALGSNQGPNRIRGMY